MKIAKDKVVGINYTLTNDQKEVIDQSSKEAPLYFLQGHRNIIVGLEKAIEGMSAGETLKVSITPEEAYGMKRDDLLQSFPKDTVPGIDDVAIGTAFQAETPDGQPILFYLKEIKGDTVIMDANHPLAGENLHFDVEVLEVREATETELAHGHVHGEHGHKH